MSYPRDYGPPLFPTKKIKSKKELKEWTITSVYTAIKKNRVDEELMKEVMKKDKWWEDRGTHYVWINRSLKKALEKEATKAR